MGMFDSIFIDVFCPHCGVQSKMECQTKELDCVLNVWRLGDYVGTKKYNYLNCVADCKSVTCLQKTNEDLGYSSGFGQMFDIEVFLKDGIVTGNYNIILPEHEIKRKVRIEKNGNETD
jgi:hypothetical protein